VREESSILFPRRLRARHDARDVRILPGLQVGLVSLLCRSLGATRGLQPLALLTGLLLTTL
jgi:hypothetical protein